MFLKTKPLKKLMKDAYNGGGLFIGQYHDHYVLEGPWWAAWIRPKFTTKEIRAAMIELGGEIPKPGTGYKCWKKEVPQYELTYNYDLEAKWDDLQQETRPSRTYIDIDGELCNVLDANEVKIAVGVRAISCVGDPSDYDYVNGEYDTGFPLTDGSVVMWQNNACLFMTAAHVLNDEAAEWLKTLKEVY